MQALLMHPSDNIAVAAADLPAGQAVEVAGEMILVVQPIPFGHKFARRSIPSGGIVFKYGQPVGRATTDIAVGAHVHVHNIESLRGRGDLGQGVTPVAVAGSATEFKLKTADAGELSATHFLGYRRKDGRVGCATTSSSCRPWDAPIASSTASVRCCRRLSRSPTRGDARKSVTI